MRLRRILEYLNREDADRAVKELSGRDLRGQAVRVDLHDDVSAFSVYLMEVR
jgi:splicing factor, arginine/serine-rich 4/5/6